jgi:DNA invertase Pin-like site-specific DNA recombinase
MASRTSDRASQRAFRCAIYTRKSTEEGLDQSFNSLDAQREACEAYIRSQRHEGWTLVRDRYDDGGFSGGSMDRPGLQRLLADVEAGRVDVIVVYKVDRLTRALSDFAKIVEILDAKGASFASVTQAFNTRDSMGRLTLNVLLSFAQFEREVTAERIRDKFAASRKKGMWMGGTPPLGYDVRDRKLVVNEAEAETVRHIMRRYVALGNGRALLEELAATGYRTKKIGNRGGIPFGRGSLFNLLGNRVYRGEAVHKGIAYPGEHDAIVDQQLWDAVQATIASGRVHRSQRIATATSLLAGKLIDGEGRRMTPSHASKANCRYRYYVTHSSQPMSGSNPAWRLPAHDLEAAVVTQLERFLNNRQALIKLMGDGARADAVRSSLSLAAEASQKLTQPELQRGLIVDLVQQVALSEERVEIELDRDAVCRLLQLQRRDDLDPILISAPASRVRRGKDVRLILTSDAGRADGERDAALVALIIEARTAHASILAMPGCTMSEMADRIGRCRTRLARLFRIAMLAPDIIAACLDGTHPVRLTPKLLLKADLPIDWREQRELLGFA